VTVIAWDGKALAGDKQTTGEDRGRMRCAQGARQGRRSSAAPERTGAACVGARARADHRIQWQRIRHPFIAIGNGGDFALGALAAGESAREAVRIASRLSASCGFGVDVVRF
jgi:hypothetical protein